MTEIFRLRFSKLTATLWLALAAMTVQAAPQQDKEDPDRERYISELRNYKHDFLTRELDLSREQQRDFFPLYDEMEDRVMKINDDIREIERKIENSDNASEIEIESAAQVIFSQKDEMVIPILAADRFPVKPRPGRDVNLTADNRFYPDFFCCLIKINNTVHYPMIGNGNTVHSQCFCLCYQFFYLTGTIQQTVFCMDM